jgi:hypothetical protein
MNTRDREPFTRPFTRREQLQIKWSLLRYDLWAWRDHEGWCWLASRLPHKLKLWAYIIVMANAWEKAGNKTPDEIGYKEACDAWEDRRVKP